MSARSGLCACCDVMWRCPNGKSQHIVIVSFLNGDKEDDPSRKCSNVYVIRRSTHHRFVTVSPVEDDGVVLKYRRAANAKLSAPLNQNTSLGKSV